MYWWQTVTTADLNADGKEDLILNIGENFFFLFKTER
jgi:hypothetical protein